MMANPYQVLNVHPRANEEQIEQAYYKKRRMISYSTGLTSFSEETINTAYAILKDPHRRSRLDKALQKRKDAGQESRPSFYQKLHKLITN